MRHCKVNGQERTHLSCQFKSYSIFPTPCFSHLCLLDYHTPCCSGLKSWLIPFFSHMVHSKSHQLPLRTSPELQHACISTPTAFPHPRHLLPTQVQWPPTWPPCLYFASCFLPFPPLTGKQGDLLKHKLDDIISFFKTLPCLPRGSNSV